MGDARGILVAWCACSCASWWRRSPSTATCSAWWCRPSRSWLWSRRRSPGGSILRALAAGGAATAQSVPLQNPFSLTAAVKFAALFAAVLLLVKLVQVYLPGRGVYGVAALAGLTDVDVITLSMADYARSNDPGTAVRAIMIASLTNTLVKCGMVVSLGGPALRRPVLLATAALLAAEAPAASGSPGAWPVKSGSS
ncbi:MAG: DUF4010 domain-containing protein [Geminicoccaceae bacterium]